MRRVAALLLVLLLACGCARSGPQADGRSCADALGDTAFPVDSAQDWVTYGDHLVAARVRPTTEGGWVELVPHTTLWSRPNAPATPPSVRAWSDAASSEGVDLLEDHAYLALLTRWQPAGEAPEWVWMDILPFDDAVVGHGPDQCWPAGSRPAREQLWGLDEAGVRRLLASTRPDPRAAPYADLDPGERYQRVAAGRG